MFHINDKGEVKPCSAINKKCRFEGAHGDTPARYPSEEAAYEALNKMSKKFPKISKRSKNILQVENALLEIGVRKGSLPPVSSHDEMLEKWFSGNKMGPRSVIETIKDDSLTRETKKSIVSMALKGLDLSVSSDIESPGGKINSDKSNVAILTEDVIGMRLKKPVSAF